MIQQFNFKQFNLAKVKKIKWLPVMLSITNYSMKSIIGFTQFKYYSYIYIYIYIYMDGTF